MAGGSEGEGGGADYTGAALELAICAGEIGNYCDHAEHNESVERDWVVRTAARMRTLALTLAGQLGLDVFALYAERLATIESAHVGRSDSSFDGGAAARAAGTWRQLQLVQLDHDRAYHVDVLGLARADQLRHYAFHVAKLAGAFARHARGEVSGDEIVERRLPDALLFGIKLATVMGEPLSDDSLERQPPRTAG